MNKLSKRVLSLLLALLMVLGTCDQALAAGLDNGRYENDNVIELPENPEPTEKPDEPDPTKLPENPEPTELPENPEPTELPENPEPTELPENPEPTEKPVVEVKEAVDVAYSDKSEGEYTVAVAEGSYSSDEDAPELKSVSVTPVEGRTVLEGWTISGNGKDLKLTVSIKTMPTLEEGETLALVALNGSVQSSQLKVVTGEDDFASVTVSDSTTGIALVKVAASAAEETPAEKPIKTEEQTMPAGNVSINGFLPVGGSVTAVKQGAAKPQMVFKSVNRAASTQSTTSAPAANEKVLASYDITILDGSGKSWQPEKPVTVTITDDSFGDGKTLQIYHQGSSGREFVKTVTSHNNTVSFPAEHFSVYVVVEVVVPRLTVKFVNGTTEVATMYVKKADVGTEQFNKIVYDPGVGTIPQGVVFRGWTTDPDYVPYDGEGNINRGMDISGIRTDVAARANALTNADVTVTYHAMLFRSYYVTYLDQNGISLGTDEVSIRADAGTVNANYTVNKAFTTPDAMHNFEGWLVSDGGDNIVEPKQDKYENGTDIVIKGDVKFGVNLPEGRWLVFHEGKGGTYKAPQFVKSVGTEEETHTQNPGAMTRQGYVFDNWYKASDVTIATDGTWTVNEGATPFEFGGTLDNSLDLYANWIPNENATYTVLIWKQNVERDGYDFFKAVTVEEATVGSTPAVSNSGTGRDAYATVNGTAYTATAYPELKGFAYDHDDLGEKTVTVTGDTVVNVYYNRNQYTLTFVANNLDGATPTYTPTESTYGELYGLVNGEYVRIQYRGGIFSGRWQYQSGGRWVDYNGVRYVREMAVTVTGYYEESIVSHFLPGGNLANITWTPHDSDTFKFILTTIEVMPAEDVRFTGESISYFAQTLNFYIEVGADEAYDTEYNGIHFKKYSTTGTQYRFITYEEDFIALTGYDRYMAHITGHNYDEYDERYDISYGSSINLWLTDAQFKANDRSPYFDGTADLYYLRSKYDITFIDGACYDGDDKIDTDNTPAHNEFPGSKSIAKQIPYLEDISAYDYDPFNPDGYTGFKPTKEGYTFAGWYIDEACTTKYDFETMPIGGVTVYAKWNRTQIRVFMHPAVDPTDTTLNWGSTNQAMCFRINYGGTVSAPYGTRDNYEFVGWFLDEDCTSPFNAAGYVLNDTNVKTPYDYKNTATEPDSIYGVGYTEVKDAGRFWVNKRLDVYGQWRKVIDGAEGIGIRYVDPNGVAYTDIQETHLYVDQASVTAKPAPGTIPEGKLFSHWVVEKWDGTNKVEHPEGTWKETSQTVFAGSTFTVNVDDAQGTVTEWDETKPGKIKSANYVLQLKAVFTDKGQPTNTFIWWFGNGNGQEYVRRDGKPLAEGSLEPTEGGANPLKINQPVSIPTPNPRAGYKFLGWYKLNSSATNPPTTNAATAPNFLWYDNGKYYGDSAKTAEATYVAADEANPYDYLYAVWEALDVHYTVEFYYQNDDGQDYTKDEELTDTRTAKAGSTVNATDADKAKTKDGKYRLVEGTPSVLTATVAGDGSTVLKVYFDLNKATVTVHHYLKGTTTKVAEDVVSQQTIGTEYTAQPVTKYQSKDLTVDSYNPSQTVTVSADGNVITIYYTLPLTITAKTDSKEYDGSKLTGSFSHDGALDSDKTTIEGAFGDPLEIGPNVTPATSYQAVTTGIPGYYVITNNPGTLTITPNSNKVTVTIVGNHDSKVYTGSAQSVEGYTYSAKAGETTIANSEFTVALKEGKEAKATGTNVATYNMGLTKDDFTVTSQNYRNITVEYTDGYLEITPAKLEIHVKGAVKTVPYNGAEQTLGESLQFTVESELPNGVNVEQKEKVVQAAKGKNVGTYPQNLTVDNLTVKGEAAGNYRVTIVVDSAGYLEITPAKLEIHVKGTDKTVVYNGEEQKLGSALVFEVVGELPEGLTVVQDHKLKLTAVGTNVGTYPQNLEASNLKLSGDTASNYDATIIVDSKGGLTITKRPVTFTGETDSRPYSGAEIELTGVTVSSGENAGLVNGHTHNVTYSAKGTEVGSYPGTITAKGSVKITAGGTDVTENYDITTTPGTLTITTVQYTINYVFDWPGGMAPAGAPNPPADVKVNRHDGFTVSNPNIYQDIPYGIAPNGNVITVLRFQGWDTSNVRDSVNNVTADATIRGAWTIQMVWYTVTYTDGVPGQVIFPDQVTTTLRIGANTPAFNGTPTREGYTFTGWAPAVSPTVTGNNVYTAQWAPIEEERTVEPTPEPTPVVEEEIIDEEVPQAAPAAAWALINLLAALGTVATAVGMIITFFKKKDDDDDGTKANPDEEDENKGKKSKFLGLIPAVASVVIFILTENMHNPMALVDKWTIPMVLILAANGIVAYLTRNKKPEDEDTEKAAG